jgi:PKD repeat protein
VVPAPTFTDATGDGMTNTLGDTVTVQVHCTFGVITPGIANILGGSVAVSAESNFPVKTGMANITEIPGVGEPGPAPVAAFIANDTIVSPDELTVIGPVVAVDFRDTSGGGPTQWEWDLGDGDKATTQDVVHTFACANPKCEYQVKLRAINVDGDDEAQMKVIVIGETEANFTSDTQAGDAPLTVEFTDASDSGATAWDWDFGDGNTGTGPTATHTYADPGTYDVTLTVTYPDPTGQVKVTKVGYITVGDGMCTVPSLTGVRFDNADEIWAAADFTGSVLRAPGAPNGNFIITAQSLTATSLAPCESNVTVDRP